MRVGLPRSLNPVVGRFVFFSVSQRMILPGLRGWGVKAVADAPTCIFPRKVT
jgi:hypothetical protein